jgi:hypothetical protein
MLNLSEKQVKEIEVLIGEMPGKFAIALLNILNQKAEDPKENGANNHSETADV